MIKKDFIRLVAIMFVLICSGLSLTTANAQTYPVLKLDFSPSNVEARTEPGFTSFTIADSGSVVDGITIELAGELNARWRGEPAGIPYELIYRDFIYARPGGITATLSGLEANKDYEITIYVFDTGSAGDRIADVNANGVYCLTTFTNSGQPPGDEDDNAYTGIAQADDAGTIVLEYFPNENTVEQSGENNPYAFVNALVISSLAPITYATNPKPDNGASCVDPNVVLSWSPGVTAASHDVYLGTNFNDVNDGVGDTFKGRQDVNSYDPGGLNSDTTYYWRIDEVNDAHPDSPWKGEIWSFTTGSGGLDPNEYRRRYEPPTGNDFGNNPTSGVNLATGEYKQTVVDTCIPGVGLDVGLARTVRSQIGTIPDAEAKEAYVAVNSIRVYGSLAANNAEASQAGATVMGDGVDMAYNIFLEPAGDHFILHDGTGRLDAYILQADGTWVAQGFSRVLTKNPDATYTLTFSDNATWNFAAFDGGIFEGKITTLTDRNGNSIQLTYDTQGRLGTITDTLNRPLTFSYTMNGQIASVTDWADRTTTYTYYQAGETGGAPGDLKSVTTPAVIDTATGNDFPNGKTKTYTYSCGFADDRLNHNLLTITDPSGNVVLQNVYSPATDPEDFSFDKVIRQIKGTDCITDIAYGKVEPSADNNYATKKTVTNDPMGNVSEHFYDEFNHLLMVRQHTGRAASDQPTSVDLTANPPVNPLRGDDPSYFETHYQYSIESLVTRIDYPNGNYVINVYEMDLNHEASQRSRANLRERHRYAGALASISDQNEIVEQFEYDTTHGGGCCGFNFVTQYTDGNGHVTQHDYDDQGNRISTTRVVPDGPDVIEQWAYDGRGRRIAHILSDNGGNYQRRDTVSYITDPADPNYGLRESTTVDADTLALTTHYHYDRYGNISRIIDPMSGDTHLVYNQLNQVVRKISPEVTDGSGIRYTTDTIYDENDRIVREDIENRDDQGQLAANPYLTKQFAYDIHGNLIRKTEEVDPDHDMVTEYQYNKNQQLTLARSGEAVNGNQPTNMVRTFYDERGLLYQTIRAQADPSQSTTQQDYDGNGNLVRVSQGLEAEPRTTTYIYDGFNRLIEIADPMGNQTLVNFDAAGNQTRTRILGELIDMPGADGNVRLSELTNEYNALNQLTKTQEAFFNPYTGESIDDGKVTTEYEYNVNSQVTKVTNDKGSETLYAYDTANRRSVVLDAKGNKATYCYDENSNLTSVTTEDKSDLGDPNEAFVTTYEYDNLNRLVKTVDNAGNTTEYTYDSRGNRTTVIDAKGTVTRYEYDGLNRLTQTVRDMDADGADPKDSNDIVTTQTWDDNSRLTGKADDKGNTTSYEYDPLNRLIKRIYADGTSRQASYDVHNNPIQTTDAAGSVVDYTYDDLNRLITKTVRPGAGVSNDTTFEDYQYDSLSRLIYAEDDDSVVTFSYDSVSNVTEETLNGENTACSYDGLGNKLSCTYPGGRIIDYTYDALNRIETVSDAGGSIATYNYFGPRRIQQRDYFNNTCASYDYDNARCIIQTTHTHDPGGTPTIIDDRTYDWDQTYNVVQRKDVRAGGPQLTHDYTYDAIKRLVHTTVTNTVPVVVRDTDYDLDGVGNRTTVTGSPDPGVYTMDNTTPEPADDQMNQYTTTSFDGRLYDKNGNLTTIDNGLPTQKDLTYDYRNRMVEVSDAGTGQIHTYSYDCFGRRIQKVVDSTGTPQTTIYLYDRWQVIEERDGGTTQATYVYGNYFDEVLNMQRGANDCYYHVDDLFNVMAVTSAAGNAVERYEYDDYGWPVDPTTLLPISGSPSAIGNPYHFNGRRYDPETGLYYYRTRYLDPQAGRFTTRDTIGIWGDPTNLGNGCSFVCNKPTARIDPFGRGVYPVDFEGANGGGVKKPKPLPCVMCDYAEWIKLHKTYNPWSPRISGGDPGGGVVDGDDDLDYATAGPGVYPMAPGDGVYPIEYEGKAATMAPGDGVYPIEFEGRAATMAPSDGVYPAEFEGSSRSVAATMAPCGGVYPAEFEGLAPGGGVADGDDDLDYATAGPGVYPMAPGGGVYPGRIRFISAIGVPVLFDEWQERDVAPYCNPERKLARQFKRQKRKAKRHQNY